MIREVNKDDKQDVYTLWKQAYPNQNRNYLNFYFKHIFDKSACFVVEQDNQIVSSIQMNEHTLQLHGKQIKMSYIVGVSTLPDYRRRGNMKKLMGCVMDKASHNHLVSFIQAFNPKLYAQFGFETIYYRKMYTIHRKALQRISTAKVANSAKAEELLQAYQKFITYFNGYYSRNLQYYTQLLNELAISQKRIVVYHSREKEISGYLIFHYKKEEVYVDEAIYTESVALSRMLKAALGNAEEIVIEVSQHEKLERIFPMVIPKKQAAIMVRINNVMLFNKLYNSKAKNAIEAFSSNKPLWCNEYY